MHHHKMLLGDAESGGDEDGVSRLREAVGWNFDLSKLARLMAMSMELKGVAVGK